MRRIPGTQARGTFILAAACLMLLAAGCGYTMRGQEGSISKNSVLGTGDKTLKFLTIEQPTTYSNVPYLIRSQLRDEITARGLAVWVDSGSSDLTMSVVIKSFRVSAYGQSRRENLLFTARVNMEFLVNDGSTNTTVWRSGPLQYSESYESVDEETAMRDVLKQVITLGVDRMQQKF